MPHGEGKREGESQGEDVKSSSHLLEVELVIIIGVGLLKEHGVLTCKRARLGCLLLHRLARRRSVRIHPVDGLRVTQNKTPFGEMDGAHVGYPGSALDTCSKVCILRSIVPWYMCTKRSTADLLET